LRVTRCRAAAAVLGGGLNFGASAPTGSAVWRDLGSRLWRRPAPRLSRAVILGYR
jgi:hypothetical protein